MSWEIDLEEGEKAEVKFAKLYEKAFHTKLLQTEGYFPDYDLYTEDKGITFEVKKDSWIENNGRFVIETESSVKNKTKGWIFHTKADFYVCWFGKSKKYMICPMFVLKDFLNEKGKNYKVRTSHENPDVRFISVPISHLPKKWVKVYEFVLKKNKQIERIDVTAKNISEGYFKEEIVKSNEI
jgi:hypothetical protein